MKNVVTQRDKKYFCQVKKVDIRVIREGEKEGNANEGIFVLTVGRSPKLPGCHIPFKHKISALHFQRGYHADYNHG